MRDSLRKLLRLLPALAAVGCIGGHNVPPACPLPGPGAPSATLLLEQDHEFGHRYQIVDVTYGLDGCRLFRVTDSGLLTPAKVDLGSHPIPPGKHVLTLLTQVRSGFNADVRRWVWRRRTQLNLDVSAGEKLKVYAEYFERNDLEARRKMQVRLSLKPPN